MKNEQILAARLRLLEYSFTHSLGELLRETLDEAETLTGSCVGFCHFLNIDQQTLTLQAWSSQTVTCFCKAEGSGKHYPISQAGVWADCVRKRHPVIHNDYQSLPDRKGMPKGHAIVVRELVVPVLRGDLIVAILGVGNKSTDYDQRDLDVVTLLADLAWDIAERKRAETMLHEKTLQLEQEIGERQRAQEALSCKHQQLEELNKTLEQRIDTAVAELRVKDQLLIQQNRQAAMGEMINNIAHQWKQPLNNLSLTIQAMAYDYEAGLLTPQEMGADTAKCMELITFMSHTIDDFRSFFRIDKQKVSFAIRQSIDRSIRLLSASLQKHDIQIVVEDGEELQVTGCPNEFSQVLLNLLGNARDVFLERAIQAPVISIRVFFCNGQTVVTVSDNGGGISPEVIAHIFNPSFSTKEQGKGSGIGLFMSKNIIEQHMGGSLTVCNGGDGAQFRIEIPMTVT
jgi:signal transduction histidine kinase